MANWDSGGPKCCSAAACTEWAAWSDAPNAKQRRTSFFFAMGTMSPKHHAAFAASPEQAHKWGNKFHAASPKTPEKHQHVLESKLMVFRLASLALPGVIFQFQMFPKLSLSHSSCVELHIYPCPWNIFFVTEKMKVLKEKSVFSVPTILLISCQNRIICSPIMAGFFHCLQQWLLYSKRSIYPEYLKKCSDESV